MFLRFSGAWRTSSTAALVRYSFFMSANVFCQSSFSSSAASPASSPSESLSPRRVLRAACPLFWRGPLALLRLDRLLRLLEPLLELLL
jgi:hypothetical protein